MKYFSLIALLFLLLVITKIFAANPSQPSLIQEGVTFSDTNILSNRLGSMYQYVENPKWKFSIDEKAEGFHSPKARTSSLAPTAILNALR